MVSALITGSSGPGSSPGRGHCAVSLGKTLHPHSASLHPGAQMGTGEPNAGGNPAMDQHPIQGEQKHSQPPHAIETEISSGSYEPVGSKASLFTLISRNASVKSPIPIVETNAEQA